MYTYAMAYGVRDDGHVALHKVRIHEASISIQSRDRYTAVAYLQHCRRVYGRQRQKGLFLVDVVEVSAVAVTARAGERASAGAGESYKRSSTRYTYVI